ncbi:MAG: response regulator [Campylobacterales bacterium]|nr:response regulator [Campylobacterales bacterium]
MMKEQIDRLKQLFSDFSILHVEDNRGLRENMEKVLKHFCTHVWCVENAYQALEVYSEHTPKILIVDLHIAGMDGFELINRIKSRETAVKIIVLSAHSEKEHLIHAIELGVFAYLTKPTKLHEVLDTLERTAESLIEEENRQILQTLLHDVFHYQNNLLLMFDADVPIMANQRFLDFFGVDSLKKFLLTKDMDKLLLEHDNFLYTDADKQWLKEVFENHGKLFHTKMQDQHGDFRHLILKSRDIPQKEMYTILSFDDVTELQLMAIFDSKTHSEDKQMQEMSTILKLFKIVQDNAAQVEIHNFYKGLSITNPAVIVQNDSEGIVLKSSFTQLKIIQFAKEMLITSEIFPEPVWIKAVPAINFEDQTITFTHMEFAAKSACQRANVRLEPEQKHTVTLFFKGRKVPGDVRIVDISICSAKIEMDAIPAGMSLDDVVEINMVLSSRQPMIIHTKGTLYRIDELKRSYHLVLLFELQGTDLKHMTEYMLERQMALIREFKSLS